MPTSHVQTAGSLQVPQFVRTAVCYSVLINIMCLLEKGCNLHKKFRICNIEMKIYNSQYVL